MKSLIITALAVTGGIAGYFVGKKQEYIQEKLGDKFPLRTGVPEDDPFTPLGCDQEYYIDKKRKVSVLITGAGSYIGESFKAYVEQHYGSNFLITTLDMVDGSWREHEFKDENGKPFDTVFHVAGIAHVDVGNVDQEIQEKYYVVNTDLAIEVCNRAKVAGVSQFVFMSSMIVYGDAEEVSRYTIPHPANFYGDSKWQADRGIRFLAVPGEYEVAVLRPPMIYGKRSKGNYPMLSKLAKKIPVFPEYSNRRSMLYIENLCEFLSLLMISGKGGIFFPQNGEYTKTSDMVAFIAEKANKHVIVSKTLSPAVTAAMHTPIRNVKDLAEKVFGNSYYDQELGVYKGLDYQKVDLKDSIRITEE